MWISKKTDYAPLERVVRLFQGPLAPIACATRSEPEPCPMEIGCTLLDAWREVRDATIAILERKTFADLARRAGGGGGRPAEACVRAHPPERSARRWEPCLERARPSRRTRGEGRRHAGSCGRESGSGASPPRPVDGDDVA